MTTDSAKAISKCMFLMQHYCKIVTERSADKDRNPYKVPGNFSQSLMDKEYHSGEIIFGVHNNDNGELDHQQ